MMGKQQRYSEGYSVFVPDYRHAVETVGETEGFGFSGRVDSEDSSAPKRKCMSLNMDKHESFNIPLQVISLSNLSRTDKRELAMRLKGELKQVQAFRKKTLTRNLTSLNGVSLSSSTNVPLKKQGSFGHNGSSLKRGSSGKFESTKHAAPPSAGNAYALLMKQCEGLLKHLMGHKHGWVFKEPVDVVKLNIPDYFQVIKHPMDLGTIKSRMASTSYSPWDFVSDVRLTFSNAKTYNPPSNDVHIMADIMSKFFESRWKSIEKKLVAADAAAKGQTETLEPDFQPIKRKASPSMNDIIQPDAMIAQVTAEEKGILRERVEALSEPPPHLIEFFRKHTDNINQSEEEIEIDIDSLSDATLIGLRKLLDDLDKLGQERKAHPCEMEILNESGLSNSSLHLCKGNEQVDDDVDIVGNDPPFLTYPTVVIEKDAAVRSKKCSSSSNDSGSSSSDSDSGSSSDSESDNKVGSPKKDGKHGLDPEQSEMINPVHENRSSDESNQREQDAYLKPESNEAVNNTEGGNAPTERQVSPEKNYRAALLKSRFADTILKAREKTLDQGGKGDTEKLRRDKEELERQQREEKARLQAEAKAAEDAQRRAEAEAAAQAAAEAKRKRELEREAARQALLQMEKTAEINGDNRFIEDLEILRKGSVECLPSLVGETSPAHSPEPVFRLGGSNPLEQLGLYMRREEEEEEEEPNSAPPNDVEEGEID